MKANPVVLKAIAGGVLAAGAAAAYSVAQVPAKRSDLGTIRALSSRLQSQPAAPETSLSVPELLPAGGPQVTPKPQPSPRPVRPSGARPAPRPAPTPAKPAEKPEVATPAPAPESPVKNIALVGVTHADERDTAWLVDTSSNERESVAEGGQAFGFTIKDVEEDAVILARDGQDYTVRLGEKQVYVASADPLSEGADFGQGMNQGRGRRDRGGFGGQGGARRNGGPGGWNRGSFGGRGGRNRGGFGGNDSAIVFGGGSAGSSSFGNRSGFSGNRGGYPSSNRGSSARGGFGGSGFSGGGGFSRGQGGSSNPFSSASNGAGTTSNPQTARRNGSTYSGGIGGTTTAPEPITNPQTQRRLGTSSANQPAFGQQQQQYGGFNQGRGQGSTRGR